MFLGYKRLQPFCSYNLCYKINVLYFTLVLSEAGHAAGSAVGWGTALQVGRSRVRFPMVSLEFFIDVILPVALWPWGWLSLLQKWVPGIFPGGKGGRCVGLTTLPPSCADCLDGSLILLEPSGPAQACNGIALPLPLLSDVCVCVCVRGTKYGCFP